MRWYAVLVIPPTVILIVLYCTHAFVSPVFLRGCFLAGVGFGIPAGFLEEIGWTGFAFPKVRKTESIKRRNIVGSVVGILASSGH
jgi:CAAX protease family protein